MEKWILSLLLLSILISAGCVGYPAVEPADESPDAPQFSGTTGERQKVEIGPATSRGISLQREDGEGSSERGIVVSGLGKRRVTPDLARFTVGVVNTAKSARQAASENAEQMNRVVEALKDLGIPEEDLQTSTVSLTPEFDYGRREDRRELPTLLGYRAENRITVTVREIERTGEVIDGATVAGANQLYGVSFTLSEETSRGLRSQVLEEAVHDAVEKAQAIAAALGAKKITPRKVVEAGGYAPPIFRYDVGALEEAKAAGTPVSPGEVEVTASVTMTFDFEY
jgi:hypothetical protein